MNNYRFDYVAIRHIELYRECVKEYKNRYMQLCKNNADSRGVKSTVYNKDSWEPTAPDKEYALGILKMKEDEIPIDDIDKAASVFDIPGGTRTTEESNKKKEEIIEAWNKEDGFKWNDKYNYPANRLQDRYEVFADLFYRDEDGNPNLRYSVMDDKVTKEGKAFDKGNMRADYRNYGKFFCGMSDTIVSDVYDIMIRREDDNNPYAFDVLKEYLDNLSEWDGVERVAELFIKYENAPDCKYVRTATTNWFFNAVRQVYEPCRYPFLAMLVLHGQTDCGKTSTLEHMFKINGEDRFTYNVRMEDSQQKIASILRTKWALGFGERVGIAKEDNNTQKQFMDTLNATISYQKKFQNEVTDYKPHNCVFVSSNDQNLLNDYTVAYNKRYYIIPCKISAKEYQEKGYWQETLDIRDQIWAEVLYMYRETPDKKLMLTSEEIEELIEIQAKYKTIDEEDIKFDLRELLNRTWACEKHGDYWVLQNEEDFIEQFKKGYSSSPMTTLRSKSKVNAFPTKYIKTWMKMKNMDSRMKGMIENGFREEGWFKKQVKWYGTTCWCKEIEEEFTPESIIQTEN